MAIEPEDSTRRRRPMRVVTLLYAMVIFSVVALLWLPLAPWSRLNCWSWEVDINTGRVRYTRYLFCLRVTRRTEDSELTKALPPEATRGVDPEWHRVCTLSPGIGNSPHYRYHAATHTIGCLKRAWESASFAPSAMRRTAETVLALWRKTGGYGEAREYVDSLCAWALDRPPGKPAITVEEIPSPLEFAKRTP